MNSSAELCAGVGSARCQATGTSAPGLAAVVVLVRTVTIAVVAILILELPAFRGPLDGVHHVVHLDPQVTPRAISSTLDAVHRRQR